jgi:hypothetical protein
MQGHDLKSIPPAAWAPTIFDRVRRFFKRHGRKLWWVHSLYALGLGLSVVFFAQRGFEHARLLAPMIGGAWLIAVVFFRLFGRGRGSVDSTRIVSPLPFFAMTYVLKNLYQGMLFFLLPFYFRSTTFPSPNSWFVVLLGACAIVSTLDIVFDRVVFRFRGFASVFHALTLFGCVSVILPAMFPSTRTLVTLLVSSGLSSLAFCTIHLNKRALVVAPVVVLSSVGMAYVARRAIPPVPMSVVHGAAGTMLMSDGRLGMEVTRLHPSAIDKLSCVTDVLFPAGQGDALVHVWTRNGEEVHRAAALHASTPPRPHTVRLRSSLGATDLPKDLLGRWEVNVETADGQLVGRVAFSVEE